MATVPIQLARRPASKPLRSRFILLRTFRSVNDRLSRNPLQIMISIMSRGTMGIVSTDRNFDAALGHADSLMYSAKQMNRNTVHATR